MCEFCSRHGEGKTWYLNAKNYSSDLVNDLKRKDFIGHFYDHVIADGNRNITLLEKTLLRKMNLPSFVREKLSRDMKVMHFGQVLPLEDVDRILAMARTVTRVACGCKWAKEKKESRLCYGITMGPPAWTAARSRPSASTKKKISPWSTKRSVTAAASAAPPAPATPLRWRNESSTRSPAACGKKLSGSVAT